MTPEQQEQHAALIRSLRGARNVGDATERRYALADHAKRFGSVRPAQLHEAVYGSPPIP